MNYREIVKNASFYPILYWDNICRHKTRKKVISVFKFILFLVFILIVLFLGGKAIVPDSLIGIVFVILGTYLIFFIDEALFASYYDGHEAEVLAGKIFYSASGGDILLSFIRSEAGRKILKRAEIGDEQILSFLEKRQGLIDLDFSQIQSTGEFISLKDLGLVLQAQDKEFQKLLSGFGIDKNVFANILEWVTEDFEREYRRELWWSREYLSRVRGVGKDWSYGRPYHLAKYGREIVPEQEKSHFDFDVKEFAEEVKQLENVLARGKDANAVLVGEEGVGISDMMQEFVRKIGKGKITPELEYKRVFELDWNSLISFNKNKGEFEAEFLNLLKEAIFSGNIILFISDLPGFILSAEALGSRIADLLESNIGSLQIVATSDPQKFHKIIEPNSTFVSHFEKISIEETDENKTIKIIEDTVRKIEKKNDLFFSYRRDTVETFGEIIGVIGAKIV